MDWTSLDRPDGNCSADSGRYYVKRVDFGSVVGWHCPGDHDYSSDCSGEAGVVAD